LPAADRPEVSMQSERRWGQRNIGVRVHKGAGGRTRPKAYKAKMDRWGTEKRSVDGGKRARNVKNSMQRAGEGIP